MAEAQWQKWYYDRKIGTVDLKPGHLVLVKVDACKGKRMIKDRWEDEACEVVHQIVTDVQSYEVMDQHGQLCILDQNQLLLITPETGIPLCVGICQAQDRCTTPTPVEPTPKESDDEIMPWVDSGLVSTWHQPRQTPLGWIDGKLDFSHGHPPEYPQRKGEGFRYWKWGSTGSCLVARGCRHPLAHRCHQTAKINDHHDYSQN